MAQEKFAAAARGFDFLATLGGWSEGAGPNYRDCGSLACSRRDRGASLAGSRQDRGAAPAGSRRDRGASPAGSRRDRASPAGSHRARGSPAGSHRDRGPPAGSRDRGGPAGSRWDRGSPAGSRDRGGPAGSRRGGDSVSESRERSRGRRRGLMSADLQHPQSVVDHLHSFIQWLSERQVPSIYHGTQSPAGTSEVWHKVRGFRNGRLKFVTVSELRD